jgi:outer membrane protein
MVLRHSWVLGLGVGLVIAPALGQTPPSKDAAPKHAAPKQTVAPKHAKQLTIAQTITASVPPSSVAQPSQPGVPHTLAEALAATYANQPALQAERAKLRATDEAVPQALAGWRPTVILSGNGGYGDGKSVIAASGGPGRSLVTTRTQRDVGVAQATVTQPIYTGGKQQASINRAKNQVMAERATLINQEQTSFTNVINAYVGVIQAQQLLALNINNEQVLAKQLQATNDRFRVGEITRTDVAQAEAALANATAQRQQAEGNLQTARGTYQQVVGYLPPGDLVEPQPLALPAKTEQDATVLASNNNPQVVAALFNDAAAKDNVDIQLAQLLPQVSLQGQMFEQSQSASRFGETNGYQIVAALSVPIYQGGTEYSQVRQAKQVAQQSNKQVADARRTVVQNTVQAWETLAAQKASADSTRQAIRANEIALEGVEREAIVGSRTTLDVLNAQQALLSSRVTLVQNLAQVVIASYAVASSIGRLTARDLHLPVPLYDETAYYNAVKNKWVGLGDYATDQPGR